jgi:hypothetical protein
MAIGYNLSRRYDPQPAPTRDLAVPSPFPGMNPYIERASVWHDFHESFLPILREMLSAQILPRYFVRIDEHMYIHELSADERRFIGRGDLLIPALTPANQGATLTATATATVVLPAPAEVGVPAIDTEALSFLEIRDRDNNELITVVELLSPSNKYAGPDREQYLAKARAVQRRWVHFVEIDLLRGGPRMPWLNMPLCDYCVVVSRYEQRPKAGFWPIALRDRLPEIPIPLRPGDADARLDLQRALHHIYDAAGYAYHIYNGPPEPAISPADAAWSAEIVNTAKT